VIAIMAIDPGKTTGVARGVFGPGMEAGLRDALRNAVELETWEVEGSAPVQAWELVAELQEWVQGLVDQGVVAVGELNELVSLVVEDFRLRTQNVDLDPVLVIGGLTTLLVPRVAGLRGEVGVSGVGGVLGGGAYAFGVGVKFQQPADAFRFATRERMEDWLPRRRLLRLWGGGRGAGGGRASDHRKAAFQHLCLRLGEACGGLVSVAPLGSPENPVVRRGRQRSWAR
jgi:hypothetical protein